MSYILDALKKSDQERQQGTSPHLYSIHSAALPGRNFAQLQLRRRLWLLVGGVLLFFTCLGIFLFLNRQSAPPPQSTVPNSSPTTSVEQPAKEVVRQNENQSAKQVIRQVADKSDDNLTQVIIKENSAVQRSITVEDTTLPPARVIANDDAPSSFPQLKDLSAALQAEIPELQCVGHTYSEDPTKRMIIINGHILREGNTIAAGTHLSQITWEGVVIDFKGTRFLIKTN